MAFDPNSFTQFANIISGYNSPSRRKIITVNGFKEAQEFKLNPGESLLFLDSNDDLLYLKQCDDIGKVALRVYRCMDITAEISQSESPSISRADLEKFQTKILEEVKKLVGGKDELNAKK